MKKISFLFVLISCQYLFAALKMEVSDQNFNSTSKIVIDQDQIKKSRALNLVSLLQQQANISIVSSNIQPNSIYIRGGDSSHVLILVDGVPVYDSSSPQRTINLFQFNLEKIKKITVLKGSQSVLYGGQALSGVIQIETFSKEAKAENSNSVNLDYTVLKKQAHRELISVNSVNTLSESLMLATDFFGLNAENNSAAYDSAKLYPQKTWGVDVLLNHKAEIENSAKISYSVDRNEISDSKFTNTKAVDVDDFVTRTESSQFSLITVFSPNLKLINSYQNQIRNFDQPPEKALTGLLTERKYRSQLFNHRLENIFFDDKKFKLFAGLQLTIEKMNSEFFGLNPFYSDVQYEGLFVKNEFKATEEFKLEAGYRKELSRLTSIADTFHVGLLGLDFLKIEYSTGFKTASLFQLFSEYGDEKLQSEKSKNLSLSIEKSFSEYLFSSVTFFESEFENLINFSFATNKYSNLDKTKTQGVEWQTQAGFLDNRLKAALSLGYQEPRDLSRSSTQSPWLARRALQSGSLRLSGYLNSELLLGTELLYSGERIDKAPSLVSLKEYYLENLFINYQLSQKTDIYVRIDNIENKFIETTYGYFNPGLSIKLGTQLQF